MLPGLPSSAQDLWAGILWCASAVLLRDLVPPAGLALLLVAMSWLLAAGVRIARDRQGAARDLTELFWEDDLDPAVALRQARGIGLAVAAGGTAGAVAAGVQLALLAA
jgi:hypothetical protein